MKKERRELKLAYDNVCEEWLNKLTASIGDLPDQLVKDQKLMDSHWDHHGDESEEYEDALDKFAEGLTDLENILGSWEHDMREELFGTIFYPIIEVLNERGYNMVNASPGFKEFLIEVAW
tara:strand:+ start:650 stop:1009 length:360 start_codon:yes stop_codon:yes gene_type:complete